MGRKTASNSFITGLRDRKKMWKVKLLPTHRSIEPPKEGGPVEVVDIGPYLPSVIKSDMTRKDKTKFFSV